MSEENDSDDELFGMSMSNLADAMNKAEKDDELEVQVTNANSEAINSICDGFLQEITTGQSNLFATRIESYKKDLVVDIRFLESSFQSIQSGDYAQVLSTSHALELIQQENNISRDQLPVELIRHRIMSYINNDGDQMILPRAVEIVALGIASFNLFLQANYTGPEIAEEQIPKIPCINHSNKHSPVDLLATDGEIPYSGSDGTSLLVFARILLAFIADPTFPLWQTPVSSYDDSTSTSESGTGVEIWNCCSLDDRPRIKSPLSMVVAFKQLRGYACWWSGRAIVTHQRLFITGAPSTTLWIEFCHCFKHILSYHCGSVDPKLTMKKEAMKPLAAEAWIEFGLAMFHFERHDMGKSSFEAARKAASLHVEMTGALGKRTKFQQRSIAQMVIKASTIKPDQDAASESNDALPQDHKLPHTEEQVSDSILLEHTEYDAIEDKIENEETLVGEQLAVLLALCLDVKNSNPKDGLTTEEMRPYVERVLIHPFNWTIYSTGLLQRAWLDFESTYARDRATLQLQALVDQHGKTLTYTQLSRDVIEASAGVGERLRFLHSVVYPPKWELKKDLANKYQELGILVSASELFMSLELWDDVVDCYSRMGKRKDALAVVQEQKDKGSPPTPRMLCSIGDLLEAPESTEYYENAWKLSGGRYAKAMRSAGREAVQLADIQISKESAVQQKLNDPKVAQVIKDSVSVEMAKEHALKATKYLEYAETCLEKSLTVQPSSTSDWFVLGTVRMRLLNWQTALTCFSTVVSHEPDAGDAWGNVGAIHLRLKRPDLALAAFTEGLKSSRESWRMWENRLLSGLQIKPMPPAPDIVYSASELLDMQDRNLGRGIDTPMLAAIVSAVLRYEGIDVGALDKGEVPAPLCLDDEPFGSNYFSSRHVVRKMGVLLERVTGSTSKATDAAAWELFAIFNMALGRRSAARDCRMKHCRQLQTPGWEKRLSDMNRISDAVQDIVEIHRLPIGSSIKPDEASATEKKQLYNLNLFVKGILSRANALGSTGDGAREKLRASKQVIEGLIGSSAAESASS